MGYNDEYIKGIFLLILGVSGNFVAETLGCQTQKLLNESMLAKQAVILMMIYFALDFGADSSQSPMKNIAVSIGIYILFIMFTKMNIYFTLTGFSILSLVYFINSNINFYKSDPKQKKLVEDLQMAKNILYLLVIGVIVPGFVIYYLQQRKDHGNDWDPLKFLFGVTNCASLK